MTYATKNMPRLVGLSLLDILHYTTTGAHTFTKAEWPGLRAVDVEVQGGGGGSGGTILTAAGQCGGGGGGGGGGYARSLLWADDLDVTSAIVVGAGGAGGAAGANAGVVGTASSFTYLSGVVQGNGGAGGGAAGASAVAVGQARAGSNGGAGGAGTGQFVIEGSDGSNTSINLNQISRAKGGASFLGGGGDESSNTTGTGGTAGYLYGGGASGSFNCDAIATDRAGGLGGQGIVIVWVYV